MRIPGRYGCGRGRCVGSACSISFASDIKVRLSMRIALVHALKHSIVPIEASFAKLWPEAKLMNLLDDSLSADLARDGKLTDAMTGRFLAIGDYAVSTGA